MWHRMPSRLTSACRAVGSGLVAVLTLTLLALAACGSPATVNPGGPPIGKGNSALIYVTDSDAPSGNTLHSYVTALDAGSGHVAWRTEVAPSFGQPIVADGVVYVASVVSPPCCNGGAQTGELSALDARSGKVRWQEKTAQVPSAPILSAGTLYLTETDSAGNRSLAAINAADGTTRWQNTHEDGVRAVVGDVVYAEQHSGGGTATPSGSIAALRASDGTPLWTTPVPFAFNTIGVAGGRVVIWIQDVSASIPHTITQRLRVYDGTTGNQLWAIADGGESQLFVSLVTSDTLYAAESTGVAALRMADGTTLWQASSAPVVRLVADASAVYASSVESVVALSRGDGHQLWTAAGRAIEVGGGALYVMNSGQTATPGFETLAAVDTSTGTTRWSILVPALVPTEYPPLPVGVGAQPISALSNNTLYLVTRANGQQAALLALQLTNGALRWQYQPGGGVGTLAL